MFQETRRRLALWYTAVTAVLLLFFASGVYLYVRYTLIDRIDDTLKHVVEVVERSIVIESVSPELGRYRVNIEASFRNNSNSVEDDRIDLEWFSPNGELLWSTFPESLNIPLSFYSNGTTVHIASDYLLRQVTERLAVGRYVLGYLRVSHPWFEVTKPIRQLLVDLMVGIGLMSICAASLGWFLSGIAIKPVNDSYQSLKQFTADASHELRNPIAMIQTNVQMALAYPDSEPQVLQNQLEIIERLTLRLGRLVNDLLFLARSDSGIVEITYQSVPLDALLIEVMEEQRVLAEHKGILLSLDLVNSYDDTDEDVFTLMGDWDQLARLFTNLISNALQYTAKEGEVTVSLQVIKSDRYPQLQVTVADNGPGIPALDLPYIFKRFYRVDHSRNHQQENHSATGAGLGLAIAQAIATNHHGDIIVESVVNQGTSFIVPFPIYNFPK